MTNTVEESSLELEQQISKECALERIEQLRKNSYGSHFSYRGVMKECSKEIIKILNKCDNVDLDLILHVIEIDSEILMYPIEEKIKLNENLQYFKENEECAMLAIMCNEKLFPIIPEEFRNNKLFVLKALNLMKSFTLCFKLLSQELQNDIEIILESLPKDTYVYTNLSEKMKRKKKIIFRSIETKQYEFSIKDRDLLLKLIKIQPSVFKYASNELCDDEEIVKQVFLNLDKSFTYNFTGIVSERLLNRKDIALLILPWCPEEYMIISDTLRKDKDIILSVFSSSVKFALNLQSIPCEKLREDRDIILAAVKQNGLVLHSLSEKFRDDKEIVLAALTENPLAYLNASERLQEDEEVKKFSCKILSIRFQLQGFEIYDEKAILESFTRADNLPYYYNTIPKKYLNEDFVFRLCEILPETVKSVQSEFKTEKLCSMVGKTNLYYIRYIPKIYRRNREFITDLIENFNGKALSNSEDNEDCSFTYLSKSFRYDVEIIKGFLKYENCYRVIPRKFRKQRDIALFAVSYHGNALANMVSSPFINDLEICNTAVNNNPSALQYCKHMPISNEIICNAICKKPCIFNKSMLPKHVFSDREIAIQALNYLGVGAFKHIHSSLAADIDFASTCYKINIPSFAHNTFFSQRMKLHASNYSKGKSAKK